jgi:hypothetical protein
MLLRFGVEAQWCFATVTAPISFHFISFQLHLLTLRARYTLHAAHCTPRQGSAQELVQVATRITKSMIN